MIMEKPVPNPYVASIPRPSIRRGLYMAVLFSLVASLIPLLFGMLVVGLVSLGSGGNNIPPWQWGNEGIGFLLTGIGIGLVFGLAAIMNYTPATRMGMIKSIVNVGSAIVLSLCFLGFLSTFIDVYFQNASSRIWLRVAIVMGLCMPVAATLLVTWYECRKKHPDEELGLSPDD